MATQPTNSSPAAPDILDAWVPHLEQIGYGLLAVGGGLAVLCLIVGYRDLWSHPPLLTWGLACSIVFAAAGLFCLLPDLRSNLSRGEALRAVVLFVLSVNGFVCAVAGLLLPFIQYREQLGGDLQSWRAHGGLLALCIGAFVGGLVLMFVGLSLGRSYERTAPAMRRLMYGYNAVFSTLLLVVILAIINVLAYSPVWPFSYLNGQPIDWTTGHIYSLKPDSKKLLGMLKEPVKVYLIMSTRSPGFEDSLALVKNCREADPQFTWETLSPQISDEKIKQLQEKYHLENTSGVLVVYGVEPETRTRLIPLPDLLKPYTDSMGRPLADETGNPKYYFTGELALMKTLKQLAFEAKPLNVYFTQGNGEMDLAGSRDRGSSLMALSNSLDSNAFVLKPLPYGQGDATKGVPEDANIVVLAGPRQPLSAAALQGLRDYVDKRNGKLLVLLGGTPPDPNGHMRQTGVEALLRNYQVDVGDGWVFYSAVSTLMTEGMRGQLTPIVLHVRVKPDSPHPIAAAFKDEDRMFIFILARTVGKLNSSTPPPGGAPLTVEELVETIPSYRPWVQKSLSEDPDVMASALRRDDKLFKEVGATKPLPLAVTVSDGNKPRLVVIGDSLWVSDMMDQFGQLRENNLQLFRACLSWLVDRPDLNIVIDDKPPTYTLTTSEGRLTQLYLLPVCLMVLCVATLGGGVWVVRRR